MQKYCSICSNEIINLSTTQQKRTRYCSEECGLIANAKHQQYYRNVHNKTQITKEKNGTTI
jgi:predicted nucleic acid-binding Zn ribbon protein